MKYLTFNVKNMTISRAVGDKTVLISGAVNYFGMLFEFDEEFATIPGIKAVEFSKNRQSRRAELVDGRCAIPNEFLKDTKAIEFRVLSGNTIGTPWTSVAITESGTIMPEEPEEEAPENMEYVKTESGDRAVPYLRALSNGLEYSKDGAVWESGVSGVPDVPKRPEGEAYLRRNGDWVKADDFLEEKGVEPNVIDSVKVDGVELPVEDRSVNIDLSGYEKTSDADLKYATKQEVGDLQTLTGLATQLPMLDYGETDTATIVSKINEIILALQTRGVVTA